MGQHLSNAQIAERLFVSTTTVKSHLNRGFAKLGLSSRAQFAAAVHGRGERQEPERRVKLRGGGSVGTYLAGMTLQ